METPGLCISANTQFSADMDEQIRLIADAGFDGIFFPCEPGDPAGEWIKTARMTGLKVHSLHAPFTGCAALWEEDEEKARAAYAGIERTIRICEEYQVPIAVSHAYIGFDGRDLPKERGLERYGRLIETASRAGVTLAFENTEGETYLDAILSAFGDDPNVGFCWDTGHEMCYNRSRDLLRPYGRYLVCTHLNDNLGVCAADGHITYLDDLHLLPFDGAADWNDIAARLKREGFGGTLTFELNTRSKPGRHENDRYAAMPLPAYLAEAYGRAVRFRDIFLGTSARA